MSSVDRPQSDFSLSLPREQGGTRTMTDMFSAHASAESRKSSSLHQSTAQHPNNAPKTISCAFLGEADMGIPRSMIWPSLELCLGLGEMPRSYRIFMLLLPEAYHTIKSKEPSWEVGPLHLSMYFGKASKQRASGIGPGGRIGRQFCPLSTCLSAVFMRPIQV